MSRLARVGRPAGVALAVLCGVAGTAQAEERLGLRVKRAEGRPGGTVALVLRTYESRPIGQGQLCLRTAPRVLSGFQESVVFSGLGDATADATVDLTQDPPLIVLGFDSPSSTVNVEDGPLAVLYFTLREDAIPGQTYQVEVDPPNTFLLDDDGQPIPIEPRAGELRVLGALAPVRAGANAEEASPGGVAILSLETRESIPLSGGSVGIQYDPAIAAGTPTVVMDPRHGPAAFTADTSTPGLVIVDFTALDDTLNRLPGDLVQVRLPTASTIPPGTQSPVSLHPQFTELRDAGGVVLPLALEADTVDFVPPSPGAASGLTVAIAGDGELALSWAADCGFGEAYGIYRGDLAQGYGSLAPEPGRCAVVGTTATIPAGPSDAEFFLVVPNLDGTEGSFGRASHGASRARPPVACHQDGDVDECSP